MSEPQVSSTAAQERTLTRSLQQGVGTMGRDSGAYVVDHYATMARVELDAYGSAVTDWELRRYFERI